MSVLYVGLGLSVYTWMLCLISTVLPYWSYLKQGRQTIHAGLWTNCTVRNDKTNCVVPSEGWIHAVQALMILATLALFISMVFGGRTLGDVSRKKSAFASIVTALIGGFLVLSAVIVFSEKNKRSNTTNSAGFALAIITVVTSFVTAALFLLSSRKANSGGYSYSSIGD